MYRENLSDMIRRHSYERQESDRFYERINENSRTFYRDQERRDKENRNNSKEPYQATNADAENLIFVSKAIWNWICSWFVSKPNAPVEQVPVVAPVLGPCKHRCKNKAECKHKCCKR